MSDFKWNGKKQAAAIALAQGYTIAEVSQQIGHDERTIYRWKTDIEFAAEVDRLSLMVDIAGRAERLRIAMRQVRQKIDASEKDLLDWLKFAQSETDGVKLDIAALIDATVSVADNRPDRSQETTGTTP